MPSLAFIHLCHADLHRGELDHQAKGEVLESANLAIQHHHANSHHDQRNLEQLRRDEFLDGTELGRPGRLVQIFALPAHGQAI